MSATNTIANTGFDPVHVEIAVHTHCPVPLRELTEKWHHYLYNSPGGLLRFLDGSTLLDVSCLPLGLQQSTRQVRFTLEESSFFEHHSTSQIALPLTNVQIHVFHLSDEEVSVEEIEPEGGDDDWTAGCDSLPLPHSSLDGLWETLTYDTQIKTTLLQYANSALLFSDRAVSTHIVHWNRIILLHGVPGTGKTSLCRSLAHKLSIRLGHRFPKAILLDVRAHSLFSKWFSTSGKLVSTLFQMVRDMLQDDPSTLLFVLIDEIESLASTRSTSSGGDPSDAMRAVNSLLTSLDRLRNFPNVLVLATTNLTHSVDSAFLDRIDLKVHIGLPEFKARRVILRTCLEELQRVNIVSCREKVGRTAISLFEECCIKSEGLSGRSLRRLPLQAHARMGVASDSVPLDDFLRALLLAIRDEQQSKGQM
eukprot:Nitzschia sp. Nitz4//scaffold4_size323378//68616//69923//NITZ4_000631-RA/size323378-exonerate_protein2genome-gene-0.199-mRNA-1//1//CDS//3329553312//3633//frame0